VTLMHACVQVGNSAGFTQSNNGVLDDKFSDSSICVQQP